MAIVEAEGERIARLEEALGINLITSNLPQLYQAEDKQDPKKAVVVVVRTLMDLPLFHRRKTMLIAHFSGRLNPKALKQISIDFECTEKALLNDWAEREKWEPLIWANMQAHDDGLDLVKQLQLAREAAVYNMYSCRNEQARVMAIGRCIESIKVEVELKQSLGQLPHVKLEPAVKVDVNVNQQTNVTAELLARYEQLVKAGEVGPVQTDNSIQSLASSETH